MTILNKFLAIPALMLVTASVAVAQNYNSSHVTEVGIVGFGSKVAPALAPSATIEAGLTVETKSFEAGKYARYAQRYLGVRVAMVSSKESRIVESYVMLSSCDNNLATCDNRVSSSVENLSVEQTSPQPLTAEEGAAKAADRIFEIRKLRRDIISGELGEGFYGAGLGAALESLKEEEAACVELFMGRTTVSRQSYSQNVALSGTTPRYTLWRFSKEHGVVDVNDLSAEPVTLQITPSGAEKMSSPASDSKWIAKRFKIADDSRCELYLGSDMLVQSVVPLYEFGYEVVLPWSQK